MGISLPFRYNSPTFQVFLVGFICFCCPGMYNALTGMGGGGKSSTEAVNNANTALSITFTVCSLLGAPVYNIFGHRVIIPAALTYVLFVGSFLSDSDGFTIAAGAILGIGAGFLWTAQAGIMMSYPNENEKGKAFSIFWMVFNLGAAIGAAIPLANNWSNTTSNVNIGTYIGFMVLMTFGAALALGLSPPSKVVRNDGTHVSLHKFSNWKRESLEVIKLFMNWRMLILIPLFAGSNWFYTYQFQVYNGGGYFNLRARGLNNMMYWLFQIIGAGFFGWLLDLKGLGTRRRRALIGNTVVLITAIALWIGCIFIQKNFTYESAQSTPDSQKTDVYSPGYAGMLIEYALFGFMDSIYQGFAYWLMGTMTNDTERAARYGGFYKTIQNAFVAIAAQVDVIHTPYMTQLIVVFVLNVVGILLAYVVCFTVPDVTIEEIDNLQTGGKEITVGGHIETVEDGKREIIGAGEKFETVQ
ncbi:major facilitator superfamily domain-containing protein [Halteromyces radiatus]|uniref:major facilitator superfamily domain-containing protein n=1 Tax=Halteromyces radiatus TaxID=101107 RepID=UPI00221E3A4F|nr:major facilitator superfamily domain-containing protein [Halteromyces radiatus]KAI8083107.1 major facilitator superfamily domain-containing protein [Halteromyces radiatus]